MQNYDIVFLLSDDMQTPMKKEWMSWVLTGSFLCFELVNTVVGHRVKVMELYNGPANAK